jgi:hypothetical protein
MTPMKRVNLDREYVAVFIAVAATLAGATKA